MHSTFAFTIINDSTLIDITVFDWQLGTATYIENNLSVFPNPTSGRLQIKSNENYSAVRIYSADGRLVKTYTGTSVDLDLSDLSSGNYTIQLITETGNFQTQFVKN